MVNMIVAIGNGRALGVKNDLLWRISDDLKRFRSLTTGHPIIMGRKTFDSIVGISGKLLPNRAHIVITRDPAFAPRLNLGAEQVIVTHSLEEALAKAKELDQEVFVIGGAQIYEQALPITDRLYLTLIDDEKPADVYFPPYEHLFTKKTFEEEREQEGLKYKWVTFER
jgi:dihydrofolate reductase